LDENKNAADLTGTTVFCQFRRGSRIGYIQESFDLSNGFVWLDEAKGELEWSKIQNFDWCEDIYYYDLKLILPNGDILIEVGGTMQVDNTVTKTP